MTCLPSSITTSAVRGASTGVPCRAKAHTAALSLSLIHICSESYQQLADDNNLPVDEVAKMAGQKLVARAQPGEYVQGLNGQWLRK